MSTSIALVTCAAVSSERRMCSAIPRRIAVIGSSDSPGARPSPTSCDSAGCGLPRRVPRRRAAGAAAAGRRGAGGAAGGSRRRRVRLHRLDEREDVLLRHAAAAAGALDVARVDPVLGGDPRDDRRDEACACPSCGRRRSSGSSAPAGSGSARPPARRDRLGRGGAPARRRLGPRARARAPAAGSAAARAAPRLAADPREHRPDLDRLALLDEDLRDDARAGARHLGVDLVGRDLEQRLVGLRPRRRRSSATS